jgi:Tfp pilus assembly protein PilO
VQALVEEKNMQIKKNEMLSKIQEDENTIKDYKEVINNKDVSLLINNINNFAKEENVKIISIEPGAQKIGQAYYDTYPFEFNVIAKNYHDLGKFIARLESSNDIYMMSRVNINKINDVEGKISVALSVDTIMIKEGNE